MDNIVLIGFMGSGKTTVGKILKRKLQLDLIDMDKRIEEKEGQKIKEIFAEKGESYFRELETSFLKELIGVKNSIISTGGGIVLKAENVNYLKEIGKVIYLYADAEQILINLKHDKNRPLLQVDNYEEKVRQMLEEREDYYLNAADIILQTNNKDLDSIAKEIMNLV